MSSAHEREALEPTDSDAEAMAKKVIDGNWGRATTVDVGLSRSSYASPLPSPDDLTRYAAHLPDVAERLMAVGEREQAHRHAIEARVAALDEEALPRFYAGQRLAHVAGLILGLAYLGVMVLAIVVGYPLAGAGGATFGIAAVIWAVRRSPADPETEQ